MADLTLEQQFAVAARHLQLATRKVREAEAVRLAAEHKCERIWAEWCRTLSSRVINPKLLKGVPANG